MTASTEASFRILTFGDVDAGVWGAVWSTPELARAIGSAASELSGPASIDADAREEWRASGPGFELIFSPAAQAVEHAAIAGFDQLCRVGGTIDEGRELECLGRRGVRAGIDLAGLDSIRDVSCWFAPDQGLSLTALRPSKTRGHDRDEAIAAALDAGAEQEVADSRLSTTYGAGGRPVRAGMELWLGGEEEAEQYPRRAAGEAVGGGAAAAIGSYELIAEPFRWHSGGSDGTGVYLLMRRR